MGLTAFLLLGFNSLLLVGVYCDSSQFSVRFFEYPQAFSSNASATFVFEVLEGPNGDCCRNCIIKCKLDDQISSDCKTKKASYTGLHDGTHSFEVCINGAERPGCTGYNWTIDTVPPTAYVTAPTSLTNASNVTVYISFSEPCVGGGGFACTANACNLLVYGAGQVMPWTLKILHPDLNFSVVVGLSSSVQYGRINLVMDKNFCTDRAGNLFKTSANSSFFVDFDRRNGISNLRTDIPEQLLQINGETRTVEATNSDKNLTVYLNFPDPVLNSSADILASLNISQGVLVPINENSLGNRLFGFLVKIISNVAVVTISLNSGSIFSRDGRPVPPMAPVTFLYDRQRPMVTLTTTSNMRTRESSVPVLIEFGEPIFGFNPSAVSISGGDLQSFRKIDWTTYAIDVRAIDKNLSIHVPENIAADVAGNRNQASNTLEFKHYSVPGVSSVFSTIATTSFAVTFSAAGLLTISTASLQSVGAFSGLPLLTSDPAKNLFRSVSHIQVFALSRWLGVTVPDEYYEFARGLQWTVPYHNLPWENEHVQPLTVDSNLTARKLSVIQTDHVTANRRSPLRPNDYNSYFQKQNKKPKADHPLDQDNSNGWREFSRSMFWLAVIGGSLILLHVILLLILRLRKKSSGKQGSYGALIFPRFEIFLIVLSQPCVCRASAAIIKGGTTSGVIVGVLLLGVESCLLLALLLFLSGGITTGKLLQYKEVHQEGQKFHRYQEIVRVTLGPGKRGQWTWKNGPNSIYSTMFGPLFEDMRGPPKYMLSQFSRGNPGKQGDHVMASDDQTEYAEAPFIQKLFGNLRIYYFFLENIKRFVLGIVVGAPPKKKRIVAGSHSKDISSRTPALILLCITSFQLFFLLLKKPFIKKRVQLVEILAVGSEVGIFSTCVVLSDKELSSGGETKIGIFMVSLFLIGFAAQMMSEWYALYRHTQRLGATNSLFSGLKTVYVGLVLILIPGDLLQNLDDNEFPSNQSGGDQPGEEEQEGSTTLRDRDRSSGSKSSGTPYISWIRGPRGGMAKASQTQRNTSKDPSTGQTHKTSHQTQRSTSKDPSTSHQTQRSGVSSSRRSGSPYSFLSGVRAFKFMKNQCFPNSWFTSDQTIIEKSQLEQEGS